MATTTVSADGPGIGVTYGNQPIMSISDSLFVLDLNDSSMEALKGIYGNKKFNNTTVLQLQKYNDPAIFERNLKKLVKYAIFENQDLCDKLFVITTDPKFTAIANAVWPVEQRAITKFRGRKWPDDKFVKEFLTIDGSGSVGQAPEKIDTSHIISWFWEFEFGVDSPTAEGPFDPKYPDRLPYPLEDGVKIEGIPDPDYHGSDDESGITSYIITYTWRTETTVFPIVESHAIPMNNLTSSFIVPQNTISVVVKRMISAVVSEDTGGSDDGGGG